MPSILKGNNSIISGNTTFTVRPMFGTNVPWDAGNLTPSNYAALSGATFGGPVSIPTLTVTSRPTFANNTPWDSGNFNPSNYATLSGSTFTGPVYAGNTSTQFGGVAFVAAESTHSSGSKRATINLGTGWSILQDSNGNGSKDFLIYNIASGKAPFIIDANGNSVYFSNRPQFGNNTPWDSGNFNPSGYAALGSSPTFAGTVAANFLKSNGAIQIAAANTSVNGGSIIIDTSNQNIRIYETGSPYRGAFLDLTTCASQSLIWTNGNFNPSNYAPLSNPTFPSDVTIKGVSNGAFGALIFRSSDGTRDFGFVPSGPDAGRTSMQFQASPSVLSFTVANTGVVTFASNVAVNGNMNVVGAINVTGGINTNSAGNGGLGFLNGGATNTGYIEFRTANTSAPRLGYIGFGATAGGAIPISGEGNSYFNFIGNAPIFGTGLTSQGTINLSGSSPIQFAGTTASKVNLYGTTFAIGVQNSTTYIRTGGNFSVHLGGVHDDGESNPGAGGIELLKVNNSSILYKGNPVWHTGNMPVQHVGQCRFTYTSNTVCTLIPYDGNQIFINGSYYTIPSAGVTLSNAGIPNNSGAYVYAYVNGSNITLETSGTGPAVNATYGHKVKTGDATRTLVGLVQVDGSSVGTTGNQFVDDGRRRFVASYYNRRQRQYGSYVTLGGATSSTSFVGIGDAYYFLAWVGESTQFTIMGTGSGSNGYQLSVSPAIDAVRVGQDSSPGIPGYNTVALATNYTQELTEGFHSASVQVKVNGQTGSFYLTLFGTTNI